MDETRTAAKAGRTECGSERAFQGVSNGPCGPPMVMKILANRGDASYGEERERSASALDESIKPARQKAVVELMKPNISVMIPTSTA